MRSIALLLFVIIAPSITIPHCSMPSPSDPVLTSVRFSPSAFDSFKRNAELHYTLRKSSCISVILIRRTTADSLVKVLCVNLNESPGSHAHTWLGDNQMGRFAPAGGYVGIVTADNERSEAAVTVFHY